jgi:tetratricopeptide (TPR) repeat protein
MHVRFLRPIIVTALALAPSAIRGEGQEWPVLRAAAKAALCSFDPAFCDTLPAGFLDDAPVCVLFSGTTHRLFPDGTVEMTVQELIRLNGRKGIDQMGEYKTITFCPSYEKVTLHEARVHKAKGGVETVTPRHVRLRDVNTDHQIYDPSKELVISFPGLDVGDVMEVHWTTRGKPPEYQGQFFYRYSFGHDKYPVARDEWTIRIPKAKTLRLAVVNGQVPQTVREDGDERVYHFAGRNFAPQAQGDRLPPADERQVQAFAGTFDTWQDVFTWERQLVADRSTCPPEGKKIVDDMTHGMTEPLDKARALTQWVRGHVRYVSSGEKHDYTPHPPARTLAQRYGDCKDTAHLLTVLCRQAGLQAGVATLGVRGDGRVNEAVPCPWGSHALCVVTIDGEDHWIDTTAEMIGWDVLPKDDRNRPCYITDQTGLRFARTPALYPADNATVQSSTVEVGSDGSIRAERSVEYRGVAAWSKRDDYVDTPVRERRRLAVAELVDGFPKVKLRSVSFENLSDFDKPLTVKTTFEEAEHFVGDKLREGTLGDVGLWQELLGININPERKVAIDLGDPFASICRYVVNLPPSLRFAQVPGPQRLTSAWGAFSFSVKESTAHRLVMEFDTRLTKSRVETAEFEEFQAFQESVQACFRANLKLKMTDDPQDALLLEEALKKSPGDAAAAEALSEIYVARQKAEDARLVLAKAREAKPEVRRLWELSVAAADGPEDEEELLRAASERFKDEPKFALSLGQNLIEQNKAGDAAKVLQPLADHADAAVKCAALIGLARVSLAGEEPKKALKQLQSAEHADATVFAADGWVLFGQTYEALGLRTEAITAYEKAIGNAEDTTDLLEALVRLTIAAGKRDDAVKYLRRLSAVADDPDAIASAAEGYARLGRSEEALELAVRAKGPDGSAPETARRAVGLALATREPARAVELLNGPDPDATVLSARIRARLLLGDLSGAEADAHAGKTVEEPTVELRSVTRQVQDLVKRRDEVTKAAGREDDVRSSADKFVCAEQFYLSGQAPDRVAALLTEALADSPPLGPAYGLRAVVSVEGGRLTKGLPDAEKAIRLAPTDYRGYFARGRILFERGSGSALPDLQRAVELSKHSDAAALHSLAAVLAQAGKHAEAIAAQREAVKLKPGVAEYQEQLSELTAKK